MTESEWLTSADSSLMWESLREQASSRKMRLFSAACFKRLLFVLPDSRQQRGVAVLEEMGDGTVPDLKRREVTQDCRRAIPPDTWRDAEPVANNLHVVALMLYREFASSAIGTHAVSAAGGLVDWQMELYEQTKLLRDIFGNPFRPIAFDPAWLTSTVLALARGIYDDRAFDRMPILADALQDAGCDNDDILTHCRGPGPHVRGCWVVDLLLGKEIAHALRSEDSASRLSTLGGTHAFFAFPP